MLYGVLGEGGGVQGKNSKEGLSFAGFGQWRGKETSTWPKYVAKAKVSGAKAKVSGVSPRARSDLLRGLVLRSCIDPGERRWQGMGGKAAKEGRKKGG